MTRVVLVIDDEDLIREVAATCLEAIGGMSVLTAATGEEGVRLAGEQQPHGILLDVMMPGLDGPSTLLELRRGPQTARIPVAFLTAKVQVHEKQALLDLGAIAVIAKPFDPLTLSDDVRDHFGWRCPAP